MDTPRDEIRPHQPFTSPEEEAYLHLQRTANVLLQGFTRLLRERAPGRRGVTPSQYDVLRILRGARRGSRAALTCGEIGERLVTPGPDVTRLLDRLEARGWVARERSDEDRRIVRARITREGLELLAQLDEPVEEWLASRLGHLGEDALEGFVGHLETAREPPSDQP